MREWKVLFLGPDENSSLATRGWIKKRVKKQTINDLEGENHLLLPQNSIEAMFAMFGRFVMGGALTAVAIVPLENSTIGLINEAVKEFKEDIEIGEIINLDVEIYFVVLWHRKGGLAKYK